jgi:hypothetical protein
LSHYLSLNPFQGNHHVEEALGLVELGTLKGNIGDQNYDVPDNVDLAKYRAVTICCVRFAVNFGAAPLMNDSMQSMNR